MSTALRPGCLLRPSSHVTCLPMAHPAAPHSIQRMSPCHVPAGAALEARLQQMRPPSTSKFVPGQRVWVRMRGWCAWPALVWPLGLCLRMELPNLVAEHKSGKLLVCWYGSNSKSWVSERNVSPLQEQQQARWAALEKQGTFKKA